MKWPWAKVEQRTVTHEDFFGRIREGSAPISSNDALSLSAVFAAIRLVAESISTLPVSVVQKDGDIRRQIDHPMADLLREPNQAMTGQTMIETLVAHLETGGEGFLEKVTAGGQVVSLWPVQPERVRPERVGGSIQFRVSTTGGEIIVGPERLAFFKNAITSPDGIRGVSPIKLLNSELSAAKAARDFASSYFTNAGTPSGVLTHPATLSPGAQSNLREQFKTRQSGRNAHSVLTLEEGMTWQAMANDPEKAQLLQTRQYSISDVARIWRLPPHMLADLSRSTFSNAESEMQSLATHSLRPRLTRLEQQLDMALLTTEERRAGLGFRFNLDGLLRGSLADRYASYQIGVTTGFLSRNEVRALENREAVTGLDEMLTTPGAGNATGTENTPNEQTD